MNRTDQSITSSESDIFYIVKAFAILNVIAAHINQINQSTMALAIASTAWEILARTGVVCFFILSGFFYNGNSLPLQLFWKKKRKGLIIPWIVCGLGTYCLALTTGKKFEILNMIQWVLGYGTWFYYVTVLLITFVLFGFFKKYMWLYIAIIATVISVFLHDILGENSFEYLNILNWCGFFSLGRIIRLKRIDRRIINSNSIVCASTIIFTIGVAISIATQRFGYFHISSLLYEVAAFPLFLKLSSSMKSILIKPFRFIGEQTLFIYLVHMQIVQFIGARFPEGIIKTVLYPGIAFTIMAASTWCVVVISRKICLLKKLIPYIGIKI